MKYVLIFLIWSGNALNPPATIVAEFDDAEACESARATLSRAAAARGSGTARGPSIDDRCYPKASKK
jgi:hypothetical protein